MKSLNRDITQPILNRSDNELKEYLLDDIKKFHAIKGQFLGNNRNRKNNNSDGLLIA